MLSEEQVERAVSVCVSCLVDNALLPGMSSGASASASASAGGSNNSGGTGPIVASKGSDKGGRKSGKSGASSSASASEMMEEDEDYVDNKEGKQGSGGDKSQGGNLEAMVTVGKSKFKVKQSTRRLLAEVGKVLCPMLTGVLASLEGLMMARRQGDRLCVAVYELAFLVLRVDPGSNPKVRHVILPIFF